MFVSLSCQGAPACCAVHGRGQARPRARIAYAVKQRYGVFQPITLRVFRYGLHGIHNSTRHGMHHGYTARRRRRIFGGVPSITRHTHSTSVRRALPSLSSLPICVVRSATRPSPRWAPSGSGSARRRGRLAPRSAPGPCGRAAGHWHRSRADPRGRPPSG